MIGQVLDRYRIESKLGEGGMGVVYKARDTHLDRTVAIKILPHDKVSDPGRKQRFVQEAKAASALNHPGIVTIHDIRTDAGIDFIVMEYVGGKTLDQLIPPKGLRPTQAVRYGAEIADALAKAHEAGIIHRDLKPSNVMVSDEGRIKILDFGLAKLLDADSAVEAATRTAPATEAGMVLGTVAYMSPEQAEGRKVDARSDIFSFGSLLYEMVTGRKAFTGESSLKILTKVLNEDTTPPSKIGAAISPDFEKVILRCLRKDPARRYQTMADLKVALEDAEEESAPHAAVRASSWQKWTWPAVAAALLLTVGFLVWRTFRAPATVSVEPLRAVPLTTLAGVERSPTFSPDGDRVAFSWNGTRQDNSDIYVQQINTGDPLRLTTDPARDYSPTWSPDGRWIAFLRGDPQKNEVRLIPPLGGSERKLTEITLDTEILFDLSLAWCPDSTCLVVTDARGAGKPPALFVVSLDSGEKRQLTFPPEFSTDGGIDASPAVSPDGKWLVFRRSRTPVNGELHRLPLSAGIVGVGESTRLTEAAQGAAMPRWLSDSKEIVFSARGSLWRLAVDGTSTPVRLPFVGEDGLTPVVSHAQPGRPARLVYVRSYSDTNIWRVNTPAPGAPASSLPVVAISSTRYDGTAAVSPNGRRVTFISTRSGPLEIWASDIDGGNAVQLTSMGAIPGYPRWSPDGEQITFHADPQGEADVLVVPSAGGKPRNLTLDRPFSAFPSFSRDGRWIYFSSSRTPPPTIWKMPSSGGPAVEVDRHTGGMPAESPDGAFLYFVEAFNAPTPLWRLPLAGGAPVKIVDGVIAGAFAVLDKGVYYVDRPSTETRLQYYDLATRTARTVASNLGTVGFSLTATADGKTILYSRLDASVDDLMLVENFR